LQDHEHFLLKRGRLVRTSLGIICAQNGCLVVARSISDRYKVPLGNRMLFLTIVGKDGPWLTYGDLAIPCSGLESLGFHDGGWWKQIRGRIMVDWLGGTWLHVNKLTSHLAFLTSSPCCAAYGQERFLCTWPKAAAQQSKRHPRSGRAKLKEAAHLNVVCKENQC
jgi:hypothetical protein